MIYADRDGRLYDEGHRLLTPQDVAERTSSLPRSGRLSRGVDEGPVMVLLDECQETIGRLASIALSKTEEAERLHRLVKDGAGRHMEAAWDKVIVDQMQRAQLEMDQQYKATQAWCTQSMADTRRRNAEAIRLAEEEARKLVERAKQAGKEAAAQALAAAPVYDASPETTPAQVREFANQTTGLQMQIAYLEAFTELLRTDIRTEAEAAVARAQAMLAKLDAWDDRQQAAFQNVPAGGADAAQQPVAGPEPQPQQEATPAGRTEG